MKYIVKIPVTIEYNITTAKSQQESEDKAKEMLYNELGLKPNDALGDIQTEKETE